MAANPVIGSQERCLLENENNGQMLKQQAAALAPRSARFKRGLFYLLRVPTFTSPSLTFDHRRKHPDHREKNHHYYVVLDRTRIG